MAKDPYKYFRIEARELLEGLSQGALELERGAPQPAELVKRLLRFAHTLKGAARVVRQPAIAELAHEMESVLGPFRESDAEVPREALAPFFQQLSALGESLKSLDPAPAPASENRPVAPPLDPFDTVRVDLVELDSFLHTISETCTVLARLEQKSGQLEHIRELAASLQAQLRVPEPPEGGPAASPHSPDPASPASGILEELRESLDALKLNQAVDLGRARASLEELRDGATRLRLLPATAIFTSLERAAQDAARTLQKRIDFEATGGEISLETHVLVAIRDALLHVVRNAVAHGIEAEASRMARGKPAVGRVGLRVERRGRRIVFTCRDDGRGIDAGAVREVAVRRGMVSASEAGRLSTEESLQLIFRGLTTSAQVNEVSGRGIGLDMVRETVSRLRGDVRAVSELGGGTVIELSVPMSMASVPSLLVDVQGQVVSIPIDAVVRTLRVMPDEIAHAAASDAIAFEGTSIPFLPLAAALQRPLPPGREARAWTAVIVRWGQMTAALGVNRVLTLSTVVVQPLPPYLGELPTLAGASLDIDGNPVLALNPEGVVMTALVTRRVDPLPLQRLPILVIDDSLTTRMLEQSILESAGYEVELATSAEEALIKARERKFGVFLVDVEMPGMDGFEFVTRTRADPVLRATPAILVTSRGGPEDRRRGQEAGASAYIVKNEFDQDFLLETLKRLAGQER